MDRSIKTAVRTAVIFLIAALLPFNSFAFSFSKTEDTLFSEKVERELFDYSGLSDYIAPETPAFSRSSHEELFTGTAARNAYVTQLCSSNEYYKSYFLDPSQRNYPVVIVTKEDLSECGSIEAAADKMKKTGRTSVMIQAGIHGDEPGAAEGALYFLQRFSKKPDQRSYLADMNIIIIPCANITGTRAGETHKDANRDNLYLESPYTAMAHNLYNHLMPEVFVDCHEFTFRQKESNSFSDLKASGAGTSNIDPKITDISGKMALAARNRATECGLRTDDYGAAGNNTKSRTYYALYGSCSVLLETPGKQMGGNHFARRVFTHYEGLMGILDYTKNNSGAVRAAVRNARHAIVARGKRYNASDRFALKTAKAETGETITYDLYDSETAEPVGTKTITLYNRTRTLRSRAVPTAYIISKKDPGAGRAVRILKKNGIRCYSIRSGRKVICAKYHGLVTRATVGKKKKYIFPNGAYVIPLDQPGGVVIGAMMEPDVNDTKGFKGSLVQSKVIKMRNIYRYAGSKRL